MLILLGKLYLKIADFSIFVFLRPRYLENYSKLFYNYIHRIYLRKTAIHLKSRHINVKFIKNDWEIEHVDNDVSRKDHSRLKIVSLIDFLH